MDIFIDTAWFPSAARRSSPNCDLRPQDAAIELLVIHGISLPPGEYGADYVDGLFMDELDIKAHPCLEELARLRVSAHLFIPRNGRVIQYVPFHMRAWHAGESEFHGRSCCNDYSIGIELEGCDNMPYAKRQYQALAAVTTWIQQHWPAITPDRIVGHCDIAPGRKTDPGAAFDWEYYFSLLMRRS